MAVSLVSLSNISLSGKTVTVSLYKIVCKLFILPFFLFFVSVPKPKTHIYLAAGAQAHGQWLFVPEVVL